MAYVCICYYINFNLSYIFCIQYSAERSELIDISHYTSGLISNCATRQTDMATKMDRTKDGGGHDD